MCGGPPASSRRPRLGPGLGHILFLLTDREEGDSCAELTGRAGRPSGANLDFWE